MRISGNGVLFDPKKNRVVARHELETIDHAIIELAKLAGWEVEGDVSDEPVKEKRTRAKKVQAVDDAD